MSEPRIHEHPADPHGIPAERVRDLVRPVERVWALSDLVQSRARGLELTPALREVILPTVAACCELSAWAAVLREHLADLLDETTP